MSNKKSGKNTLLMSVIMSSPGPIIVGLGLLAGKSSTQLADFVRRSSELMGIVLAYAVYRITSKDGEIDAERRNKLLKFTSKTQTIITCTDFEKIKDFNGKIFKIEKKQ